jgi:hypothetical protein
MLGEVLAGPVKVSPVKNDIGEDAGCLEHANALGHYFITDTVTGYNSNIQGFFH